MWTAVQSRTEQVAIYSFKMLLATSFFCNQSKIYRIFARKVCWEAEGREGAEEHHPMKDLVDKSLEPGQLFLGPFE